MLLTDLGLAEIVRDWSSKTMTTCLFTKKVKDQVASDSTQKRSARPRSGAMIINSRKSTIGTWASFGIEQYEPGPVTLVVSIDFSLPVKEAPLSILNARFGDVDPGTFGEDVAN